MCKTVNVMSLINTLANVDTRSVDAFPADAGWVCLEWEIDTPPAPSFQAMAIKGAGVTDLRSDASTRYPDAGGPQQPTFGAFFPSPVAAQPAFDVWFDEVAIDSAPVGCAR